MQELWKPGGKSFSLFYNVQATKDCRVHIFAFDNDSPQTLYTDRYVNMTKGQVREFELKFPLSPKELGVVICEVGQEAFDESKVPSSLKIIGGKVTALKACPFINDVQSREFAAFAAEFCKRFFYFGKQSGTWTSKDGRYEIKLMPVIKNSKGEKITTPARIHHYTGKIEVSYEEFSRYSIPAQMMILLHEYSHNFRNPEIGYNVQDETAADINGLQIYLSLGFPHIDSRLVFVKVFLKKETPQNIYRMNMIEAFISSWEKGEIKGSC